MSIPLITSPAAAPSDPTISKLLNPDSTQQEKKPAPQAQVEKGGQSDLEKVSRLSQQVLSPKEKEKEYNQLGEKRGASETAAARGFKLSQVSHTVGPGLPNLGNTCWLNCGLQFLAETPWFDNVLSESQISPNATPFLHALVSLINKIRQNEPVSNHDVAHFQQIYQDSLSPAENRDLGEPLFEGGQQSPDLFLFSHLLSRLHDTPGHLCLGIQKKKEHPTDGRRLDVAEEKHLVAQIMLDRPSKEPIPLADLLQVTEEKDSIDSDFKVPGVKVISSISTFPNSTVIYLNRGFFHEGENQKNQTELAFDFEKGEGEGEGEPRVLFDSPAGKIFYRVGAAIVHHGEDIQHGHYTSAVFKRGRYLLKDDLQTKSFPCFVGGTYYRTFSDYAKQASCLYLQKEGEQEEELAGSSPLSDAFSSPPRLESCSPLPDAFTFSPQTTLDPVYAHFLETHALEESFGEGEGIASFANVVLKCALGEYHKTTFEQTQKLLNDLKYTGAQPTSKIMLDAVINYAQKHFGLAKSIVILDESAMRLPGKNEQLIIQRNGSFALVIDGARKKAAFIEGCIKKEFDSTPPIIDNIIRKVEKKHGLLTESEKEAATKTFFEVGIAQADETLSQFFKTVSIETAELIALNKALGSAQTIAQFISHPFFSNQPLLSKAFLFLQHNGAISEKELFTELKKVWATHCNDTLLGRVSKEDPLCQAVHNALAQEAFLLRIPELKKALSSGTTKEKITFLATTLQDTELLSLLQLFELDSAKSLFIETLFSKYLKDPVVSIEGSQIEIKGAVLFLDSCLASLAPAMLQSATELRMLASDLLVVNQSIAGELWQGKNVVAASAKLLIQQKVTWDVSGKDSSHKYGSKAEEGAHAAGQAFGNGVSGKAGAPGASGKAGESGGNVLILTNQIEQAENLTIRSVGGAGSQGQNGGNGGNGTDGRDGLDGSLEGFPPMAKWGGGPSSDATWTTLLTLEKLDPAHTYQHFHGGNFYVTASATDGRHITCSFDGGSAREALVLVKGGKGGKKGAGGNGGPGGAGGDGGYGGDVRIISLTTNKKWPVKIEMNDGQPGAPGSQGKQGNSGRGGRSGLDAGYIDYVNIFFGLFNAADYPINYHGRLALRSSSENAKDRVKQANQYLYIEKVAEAHMAQERNDEEVTATTTLISNHARESAVKQAAIPLPSLMRQFSELCESNQVSLPTFSCTPYLTGEVEKERHIWLTGEQHRATRSFSPSVRTTQDPGEAVGTKEPSQLSLFTQPKVSPEQATFHEKVQAILSSRPANSPLYPLLSKALLPQEASSNAPESTQVMVERIAPFFPKDARPYIRGQLLIFAFLLHQQKPDLCNSYLLLLHKQLELYKSKLSAEDFQWILQALQNHSQNQQDPASMLLILSHPVQQWVPRLVMKAITSQFKLTPVLQAPLAAQLQKIHPEYLMTLADTIGLDNNRASIFTINNFRTVVTFLTKIGNSQDMVHFLQNQPIEAWEKELKIAYLRAQLFELFPKMSEKEENSFKTALYYLSSIIEKYGLESEEQLVSVLQQQRNNPSFCLKELLPLLKHWFQGKWSLSESLSALKETSFDKWFTRLSERGTASQARTIQEIVQLMKSNPENGDCAVIDQLATSVERVLQLQQTKLAPLHTTIETFTKRDIETWCGGLKARLKREDATQFLSEHIHEIVAVLNQSVFLYSEEAFGEGNGFELRDTQLAAILLFLQGKNRVLEQIATGEGKSLIVACLAIVKTLLGEKVDIITSSSPLAKEGVLNQKALYKLFGITASHNSSSDIEERKVAYQCHIVYGDIGGFQRDFLLENFYQKAVRGARPYSSVICDEVDSLVLDKGTNMLYLSDDIPNVEALEEIYVVIWEAVHQFAIVSQEDIEKLHLHVKQQLSSDAKHPEQLAAFVERRLLNWIKLAVCARDMEENKDYIVDVDHTESSRGKPSNIVIMDNDIGVEQFHSQWGGGLHQFLQLKHQCEFSSESLKSVFISNVSFIQKYKQSFYGLTGTLGRHEERRLLAAIYQTAFYTIPSYRPSQFEEETPLMCKYAEEWHESIVESAREKTTQGRGVLIIFETIAALTSLKQAFSQKGISVTTYEHSYQEFKPSITCGEIILATNLAGRGTDIKISKELEAKGGLHVCLTYLPPNLRVEEQAFGRAARKGERGSGRFIVVAQSQTKECHEAELSRLKCLRDQNEHCRLKEIKEEFENRIKTEEELLGHFSDWYKAIAKKLGDADTHLKTIVLAHLVSQWSQWLDGKEKELNSISSDPDKKALVAQFQTFRSSVESELVFSEIVLKEGGGRKTKISLNVEKTVDKLTSSQLLLHFGKILFKEKKYALAKSCFSRVIQLEPDHAEFAYYYLAACQLNSQDDLVTGRKNTKETKQLLQKSQSIFKQRQRHHESMIQRLKRTSQLHQKSAPTKLTSYDAQKAREMHLSRSFLDSIDAICGKPLNQASFQHVSLNESILQAIWKTLQEQGFVKPCRIAKSVRQALARPNDLQTLACYSFIKDSGFKVALIGRLRQLSEREKASGKIITADDFQDIVPNLEQFKRLLLEHGIITNETKTGFQFNPKAISATLYANPYFHLTRQDFQNIDAVDAVSSERIFTSCVQQGLLDQEGKITPPFFDLQRLKKEVHALFPEQEAAILGVFFNQGAYSWALHSLLATFEQTKSQEIPLESISLHEKPHERLYLDLFQQGILKQNEVAIQKSSELGNMDAFRERVKKATNALFTGSMGWFGLGFAKTVGKVTFEEITTKCAALGLSLAEITKLWQELQEKGWLKETLVQCKESEREQRKELSSEFRAHQEALWDFLICRTINPDEIVDRLFALLRTHLGTLKSASEPETLLQDLLTLFDPKSQFEFADVLAAWERNGFADLCKIDEKAWSLRTILSIIAVVALGVIEIVGGAIAEIYTLGTGSYFAGALVGEGVSDIMYALNACYTGQFSWKEYRNQKMISLVTSLATAGLSAYKASKEGIKLSRYGHKITGSFGAETAESLVGKCGKELLERGKGRVEREVAKRIIGKVAETAAKGFAYMATDALLNNQFNRFLNVISETIVTSVSEDIDAQVTRNNFASQMRRLYSHNPQRAEAIISDCITRCMQVREWEGFLESVNSLLNHSLGTFSSSYSKVLRDMQKSNKVKNAHVIQEAVKWTGRVLTTVQKGMMFQRLYRYSSAVVDRLSEELNKQLKETMTDVEATAELTTKVNQHLRSFKGEMVSQVQRIVTNEIAKPTIRSCADSGLRMCQEGLSYAYRSVEASFHSAEFKKLLAEKKKLADAQKTASKEAKAATDIKNRRIADGYRKLMAKVRDPELYAQLVESGAPVGPAELCATANCLNKCIKFKGDTTLLKKMGFPKEIHPLSGELGEPIEICFDPSAAGEGVGHFTQDSNGAPSPSLASDELLSCFYESIAAQLPRKPTVSALRQAVAEQIRTDTRLHHHIREGHFHHFIDHGIIGGSLSSGSPSGASSSPQTHSTPATDLGIPQWTYQKEVERLLAEAKEKGLNQDKLAELQKQFAKTEGVTEELLNCNLDKLIDTLNREALQKLQKLYASEAIEKLANEAKSMPGVNSASIDSNKEKFLSQLNQNPDSYLACITNCHDAMRGQTLSDFATSYAQNLDQQLSRFYSGQVRFLQGNIIAEAKKQENPGQYIADQLHSQIVITVDRNAKNYHKHCKGQKWLDALRAKTDQWTPIDFLKLMDEEPGFRQYVLDNPRTVKVTSTAKKGFGTKVKDGFCDAAEFVFSTPQRIVEPLAKKGSTARKFWDTVASPLLMQAQFNIGAQGTTVQLGPCTVYQKKSSDKSSNISLTIPSHALKLEPIVIDPVELGAQESGTKPAAKGTADTTAEPAKAAQSSSSEARSSEMAAALSGSLPSASEASLKPHKTSTPYFGRHNSKFLITGNGANRPYCIRDEKGRYRTLNQVREKSKLVNGQTEVAVEWWKVGGSTSLPGGASASGEISIKSNSIKSVKVSAKAEVGITYDVEYLRNPMVLLHLVNPNDQITVETRTGVLSKVEYGLNGDPTKGPVSMSLKGEIGGGYYVTATIPIVHSRLLNVNASASAICGFVAAAGAEASLDHGTLYINATIGSALGVGTGYKIEAKIQAAEVLALSQECLTDYHQRMTKNMTQDTLMASIDSEDLGLFSAQTLREIAKAPPGKQFNLNGGDVDK